MIPVYNRASLIGRAVGSVLDQQFTDFELIVVDDGSTDDTCAGVQAFADPRIRLVRLESNRGSNAARNRGIEAATAPLVCFLDSDDVYLPHKLGTVVRFFEQRPQLDVLVDSFSKAYPSGDPHNLRRRTNPRIECSEEFAAALFSRRLWKATSAISVRRDAALNVGAFDETLKRRQDFDFLVRLCNQARCASTDEVLWVKTWTPGAISDDPSSFIRATLELCRRHPEYVKNPAYRPGLARDVTRHLGRMLGSGRVGRAARDFAALNRELGLARLAALVVEGGGELWRRRTARRQ